METQEVQEVLNGFNLQQLEDALTGLRLIANGATADQAIAALEEQRKEDAAAV